MPLLRAFKCAGYFARDGQPAECDWRPLSTLNRSIEGYRAAPHLERSGSQPLRRSLPRLPSPDLGSQPAVSRRVGNGGYREGFRMPARPERPRAPGPASEILRGRNPREVGRGRAFRGASSYRCFPGRCLRVRHLDRASASASAGPSSSWGAILGELTFRAADARQRAPVGYQTGPRHICLACARLFCRRLNALAS